MQQRPTTSPFQMISLGGIFAIAAFSTFTYFRGHDQQLEQLAMAHALISANTTSAYDANDPKNTTLTYKFQVDGKTYTGAATLPPDDFKAQQLGSPLLINYLPSNPAINAYQPDSLNTRFGLIEKMTLLMAGIGVFSVIVGFVKGLQNGWTTRFT